MRDPSLSEAHKAGIIAYHCGERREANPYDKNKYLQFEAWAWDLGWRMEAWVERAAK